MSTANTIFGVVTILLTAVETVGLSFSAIYLLFNREPLKRNRAILAAAIAFYILVGTSIINMIAGAMR